MQFSSESRSQDYDRLESGNKDIKLFTLHAAMESRFFLSLLLLFLVYIPTRKKIQDADLERILRGLLREEGFRPVDHRNKVAVGFGSCEDVFADGLAVLEALGVDLPEKPKHHDVVASMAGLAESFAYHFEYGAAAERYVSSAALFDQCVTTARSLNGTRYSIGGNAPVMADRFALEGWQVLLGAVMKESTIRCLHKSIQVSGSALRDARDDVHLILEYDLGSTWGPFTSPRANRYIIHNDQSNMMLESLDPFLDALKLYDPSLVVVGGLQMLDNFPLDLNLRTEKLKVLQQLLISLPKSTKIHFEMASFTEERFFQELMTYVLPYADSLGMNEQELANLCSMIEHGNITFATDSYPRVATTLDQIRVLYNHLKTPKHAEERPLSRIHVHTLAYQAILVRKHSDWRNIHGAVAKASLTATRHVCASKSVNIQHAKLIMDDSFLVSQKPGSHRMPLIDSAPVSCWSETSVKICVAPNLVCTLVHQTAGGGDNISAAGLVLQL